MDEDKASIRTIELLEEEINAKSKKDLAELLYFFHYIQDTLIIAFDNTNKIKINKSLSNNPKFFVLLSTTRAFSLSKIAMDITLRGYPLEGISLTRTLTEYLQCTQYLVRHPNFIDSYIKGDKQAKEILKLAKLEKGISIENNFGKFWGLTSKFAHATSVSLVIPIIKMDEGERINIKLILNDTKLIEETAYGLMSSLFLYFLVFYLVLGQDISKEPEIKERNKEIFNLENIRKYVGLHSVTDKDLISLITYINEEL